MFTREYYGSNKAGNSGEKWLDSRYILKLEPTDFGDGLDMCCERKRQIKGDRKSFGLFSWKNGADIYPCYIGKTARGGMRGQSEA